MSKSFRYKSRELSKNDLNQSCGKVDKSSLHGGSKSVIFRSADSHIKKNGDFSSTILDHEATDAIND